MNFKNIVVGSGFSGAVVAREIAERKDEKVLIIEKRQHIGGNCYDYYNEQGILIHKYGPHIFHTDNREVWNYISQFTEWEHHQHKVLAYIDGKKVNLPFNLNTLYSVFPEVRAKKLEQALLEKYNYNQKVPILKLRKSNNELLNLLAEYIYNKIFKNYTQKQWGVNPEELSPEVSGRVPIVISRDNRYFTDQYQGLPKKGYTKLFDNLLDHKNIKIMLNTDFFELFEIDVENKKILYNDREFEGYIYYTGQIDELFGYRFDELPYRSLQFKLKKLDINRFQDVATANYPNDYNYTRITEFKNFYKKHINGTVIAYEYPQPYTKKCEEPPYYPIFNDKNQNQFKKYLSLANQIDNLTILGRLAEYKYFDMDDAVENVLEKINKP